VIVILLFVTDTTSVSQRGVVFFRNQDINIEDQKVLGQKLGELTGKPETSKVIGRQNVYHKY